MAKKRFLLAASLAALLPAGAEAQVRASIASLPSGFGLSGGAVGVTLSGLYAPRQPNRLDGDLGLAIGFGDPVGAVGFTFSADITSLHRNFADSGYFNVSVHRQFRFTNGYGSVQATVSGIGAFGTASARQVGGSLVGTFVTGTPARPYMLTVGIANDLNLTRDVEGILGVGVGLNDRWAVSAGVYGDNTSIGATYFPSQLPNVVVQVALRNVHDSARRGIGFTIGYGFSQFRN